MSGRLANTYQFWLKFRYDLSSKIKQVHSVKFIWNIQNRNKVNSSKIDMVISRPKSFPIESSEACKNFVNFTILVDVGLQWASLIWTTVHCCKVTNEYKIEFYKSHYVWALFDEKVSENEFIIEMKHLNLISVDHFAATRGNRLNFRNFVALHTVSRVGFHLATGPSVSWVYMPPKEESSFVA